MITRRRRRFLHRTGLRHIGDGIVLFFYLVHYFFGELPGRINEQGNRLKGKASAKKRAGEEGEELHRMFCMPQPNDHFDRASPGGPSCFPVSYSSWPIAVFLSTRDGSKHFLLSLPLRFSHVIFYLIYSIGITSDLYDFQPSPL